jgi:hypothetical protein
MNKDREITDKLDGMKKDLPFSLPENYFENFPERLRDSFQTRHKSGFFEKTYRLIRPQLAMAAALAAFILAGYFIVKSTLNSARQTDTTEEYADIIDYYIYDFDDETIMTVFTEENNLNYLNHTFEAEEIINYLSNEDNLDDTELQDLY